MDRYSENILHTAFTHEPGKLRAKDAKHTNLCLSFTVFPGVQTHMMHRFTDLNHTAGCQN